MKEFTITFFVRLELKIIKASTRKKKIEYKREKDEINSKTKNRYDEYLPVSVFTIFSS